MYAISVKVVAGWSIAVRCRLQNRQNQGTFFDSGWTRPNDRECSAEAADTCKLLFLVMFHIYSSISSSFSLSSFLSLSLSSNVSWVRELISYSSNFTLLLLYRNKTKTTVQKSVTFRSNFFWHRKQKRATCKRISIFQPNSFGKFANIGIHFVKWSNKIDCDQTQKV